MVDSEAGTKLGGEPARRAGSRTCRQKLAGRIVILSWFVLALLTSAACDPLTVHKVTSTIFDGVPSLPPADQYCQEYHLVALSAERDSLLKQLQSSQGSSGSAHPPFADKRCAGCHDKNTDSGFVVAADQLCAHCHKGFPSAQYLHGPAAVGACLKCHLPHSSPNPSLLSRPKAQLCGTCHTEPRVAEAMHAKVTATGMSCTDCHDPHGGNNHYFLR